MEVKALHRHLMPLLEGATLWGKLLRSQQEGVEMRRNSHRIKRISLAVTVAYIFATVMAVNTG